MIAQLAEGKLTDGQFNRQRTKNALVVDQTPVEARAAESGVGWAAATKTQPPQPNLPQPEPTTGQADSRINTLLGLLGLPWIGLGGA